MTLAPQGCVGDVVYETEALGSIVPHGALFPS